VAECPFYGHCGSSAFISGVHRDFGFKPNSKSIAASRRTGVPGPRATSGDLFNDLVGHCKNLRRQIEAERFRGFKIDHELELGCLQHR
jgi:hypothetical protein